MIWETNSSTIVMMTKLEERTRIKCDQYYPTRGTESYGPMHVTLMNVEEISTYCIRTFILQRTGYLDKKQIRQFQFLGLVFFHVFLKLFSNFFPFIFSWPDHGVPNFSAPFLMFLRRVNSLTPIDAGPQVIHCSAGVGRSACK